MQSQMLFRYSLLSLLLLAGCEKDSVKRISQEKEQHIKYKIEEVLKPSKYLVIMKVVLDDADLRSHQSYIGLGEYICNKHEAGAFQCDLVFTNKTGSENFNIATSNYTESLWRNIAAKYNSASNSTSYSCFYVKAEFNGECVIGMGEDLLIRAGDIPNFNYKSAIEYPTARSSIVYESGSFSIFKAAAVYNKLTDELDVPEMYYLDIKTNEIGASCVVGSKPVIRFAQQYSDQGLFAQLAEISYRIEKGNVIKLKQSMESYLITHRDLQGGEVILSPRESEAFIGAVKDADYIIIGKHIQRDIKLAGLKESWDKLRELCFLTVV